MQGQRPNPTIGQDANNSALNPVGTYFLGRYRVVDEIGIGGMASVHLARMDGPGGFQKWVAIKRIHAHLVEDESFIQMFLDEARVAARISHPNVATVFELGKHEDTYWIAMEYLHGEPLRELIRRTEELATTMPPEIACRVIADAAEGLHAAHELLGKNGEKLNLVHRDVTPHNLFVTYDGTTKVVDFGIAKFSSRMASTRAGTLKGKLAYMSPEQVAGEQIDRRTDIFALGVVLWELTVGQRLFRMESDLDTLAKVQECNVPKPSALVRGYPLDLEKIVMTALSKNKNERFKTAREFSRALQSLLMKRGLFIASDEVATYTQSILKDRIEKREAHLRWAAEVTQTISLDAADGAPAAEIEGSLRSYSSAVKPTPAAAAPIAAASARPAAPRPAAGAPALGRSGESRSASAPNSQRPSISEPHDADDGPTIMSAAPEIDGDFDDADRTIVSNGRDSEQAPAASPAAGRPASDVVPMAVAVPPHTLQPRVADQAPLPAVVVDAPPSAEWKPHTQPPQGFGATLAMRPTPPLSPSGSGAYPPAPHSSGSPMFQPPPYQQPYGDPRTNVTRAPSAGVPMWAVAVFSGVAALALLIAVYVYVASPRSGGPHPTGSAIPSASIAAPVIAPIPAPLNAGPFGAARAEFTLALATAPTSATTPSANVAPPPPIIDLPANTANPVVVALPINTAPAPALPNPVQPIVQTPHPPQPSNRVPTGQLTVICTPSCDAIYDGASLLGAPPIYKRTLPVGQHRIRLVSNNPSATKTISVMIAADQVDVERVSMVP